MKNIGLLKTENGYFKMIVRRTFEDYVFGMTLLFAGYYIWHIFCSAFAPQLVHIAFWAVSIKALWYNILFILNQRAVSLF